VPELICADEDEYVAKAVALAADPERRAALRRRLRSGRGRATLFDTPRLVSSLETLYAAMWDEYCQGRLPSPDLANMEVYREIGAELALSARPDDADLHRLYRDKLAERRAFTFLQPDRRILGSAGGRE
jgi:hypothetical protein